MGEREEPLVHVYVGLLADDVGEAAADTFDGGKSEHYLLLSVHVRIEDTQNVLELLIGHQRLRFPPPPDTSEIHIQIQIQIHTLTCTYKINHKTEQKFEF